LVSVVEASGSTSRKLLSNSAGYLETVTKVVCFIIAT